MPKIKVNIITGFLGAGKTTAILNLLKEKDNEERWAIIINEFGETSIDHMTLSEYDEKGKLYEVSGGCICCSAKVYFHDNLNKIIEAERYDRIIVEPTGLGGPDMVTEIIISHIELQLMPTICLVDINGLENKKLQLIPMYRNQIEKADILGLSKCDLVGDSKLISNNLKNLNKSFPGKLNYFTSTNGQIDLKLLDGNSPKMKGKAWSVDLAGKNITSKTFTFSSNYLFNIERLVELLEAKNEIIRAKGFLNSASGWRVFNYTLTGSETKICGELPQAIITVFIYGNNKDYFGKLEKAILNTTTLNN